jgi:hypothetical protein
MKISPVGVELIHTDRRTKKNTNLVAGFADCFANAPENKQGAKESMMEEKIKEGNKHV